MAAGAWGRCRTVSARLGAAGFFLVVSILTLTAGFLPGLSLLAGRFCQSNKAGNAAHTHIRPGTFSQW